MDELQQRREEARHFGEAIRPEFELDFSAAHLNHGSFGAAPRPVLAAQAEWRRRMERNIGAFFIHELPVLLRRAAAGLAAYLHAAADDIAFVDNATTGAMAVLNSLRFTVRDEILITNQSYGAVRKIAQHVAQRSGATLVEAELPFPADGADAIAAAWARRLSPHTRIAVLDHITSPTAAIMPLAAMIAACRGSGTKVLIDGAHVPGMMPLDVPALGADWYVGNAHKWLMAPKGCGFLWAARAAQDDLHPVVISHGYGKGFTAEFDWTGTRDPSACLALAAALEFRARLGDAAIMAHNRDLAERAAAMLSKKWRTRRSAAALQGSMAMVELPQRYAGGQEKANDLRRRLWTEHRIDVPVIAWNGQFWVRVSAQIYNTLADYERLAEAIQG